MTDKPPPVVATPIEPAGPPFEVGVIFALRAESGGFEDLLSGVVINRAAEFVVRVGSRHNRRIVLLDSGVGQDLGARAAETLISGHRPRLVISAGFCGALREDLAKNDIIVANGVLTRDEADGQWGVAPIDIPPELTPSIAERGVHVGRLVTVDRIIARPADKHDLGIQSGALAVDMETWGVMQACRLAGVDFLSVRIVSDSMSEELPTDVEHLARQTSSAARVGAAMRAIFRRPSSLKDMWKLKETALLASDRLAKFLGRAIDALVPAGETNP